MPGVNYAAQYSQELANAYPYALYFGALYATPNNGRYKMGEDGKTIYIPRIKTSGRVDSDRDTIAMATRNYDNSWEPKTLTHHRKWSTLVHPKDIDQTNHVASIANITQTFNEEQKFPEMDAYCVSTLLSLWKGQNHVPDTTVLTADNVLSVFDKLMLAMDNNRVPASGRILYVTFEVQTLIKNAKELTRNIDVQSGNTSVNRRVSRIDEVEIVGVPNTLMRSAYNFTQGWQPEADADQINMFLVHPSAVITPVSYEMATLDQPSGVTEGKYLYFEESDEDVFILNAKSDALQFNVTTTSKGTGKLTGITIGSNALTPEFTPDETTYTVNVSTATSVIKATAASDVTVAITLDNSTESGKAVNSGDTVTWATGTNTLKFVATKTGGTSTTYTVTVTKA